MLKTPFFTVLLATSFISGCSTVPLRDSSTQDVVPISDDSLVVLPVTIDGVQGFENVDPNSIAGRAPADRVIYFDYDKSELHAEFLDIVAQHGRFLAQNPAGQVRLEGHTDERGTREYNIALGEARAKTIARMLQLQGVGAAQSRVVSYGEEIPVDEAHNNDAWAKNRRVNIIYESDIQN
jgi:peptidoglycan-associated lipoprotein